VLSYTLLYTLFLKRRSPYGTIPGGIPGALPVLIGYSAVAGHVGMDGIILFSVMLLWQPPHFWSLALAHMEEYRGVGVPVLPVALGEPYTKILIFLYAIGLLPTTLALWVFGYCSAAFAWLAFALWCSYLLSCYRNVVSRRRFRRAFFASILYIMAVLLAVIVDVSTRAV
jgi:protoheme IX farnesyltransferase